jgi:hypothetical protein
VDLRDLLARAAASRCHVFLAEMPGAALARMQAERELVRRGWVQALSPAAADILCVCGDAPEALREPLERLWEQLPGPRARVVTADGGGVPRAFDAAQRELLDADLQEEDARHRPTEPAPAGGDGGMGGSMDIDHEDSHQDMDHGGMDMDGGMDHSGMDHGEMDMPMPGGIPLAGGGPDRDGLDLDVLTLRLGPILAFWPPGLTMTCRLQGDLVVEASVGPVPGQPVPGEGVPPKEARAVVLHEVDRALAVLRLAAAADSVARVRRVRDAALGGAPLEECRGALEAELGRMGRAVLLRRSLRGLGVVPADSLHEGAGTDAWDRLLGMLRAGADAASGSVPPVMPPGALAPRTSLLEELAVGQDLAAVRLIAASLDLVPATAGVVTR